MPRFRKAGSHLRRIKDTGQGKFLDFGLLVRNVPMSSVSVSQAQQSAPSRTLVWDAPVRLVHWLLAACFAVAWVTSDSDGWRLVHVTAGYTAAGLVAFRIVWGLVGSTHARFADFVRGPRAIASYLKSLIQGRPEHHAGHNPAGALAILAMLALAALTAATGWAHAAELGGKWLKEVHEALATAWLVLVIVHVVAVLVSSWAHRENLAGTMVHGYKVAPPREGIARPSRAVAAAVLAAVLGFWFLQWQNAPVGGLLPGGLASERARGEGADDD